MTGHRKYLPENAVLFRIEGGNHTQFGDYRGQLGDGKAAISRVRQQALTVGAILTFLQDIGQAGKSSPPR